MGRNRCKKSFVYSNHSLFYYNYSYCCCCLISTQGHVERSLTLRDDDPMCFYLLGRWCYEVGPLLALLNVEMTVRLEYDPVCVCVCVFR